MVVSVGLRQMCDNPSQLRTIYAGIEQFSPTLNRNKRLGEPANACFIRIKVRSGRICLETRISETPCDHHVGNSQ